MVFLSTSSTLVNINKLTGTRDYVKLRLPHQNKEAYSYGTTFHWALPSLQCYNMVILSTVSTKLCL